MTLTLNRKPVVVMPENLFFSAKAKVEYHTKWILAMCDQGLLEYYHWWVWKITGYKVMKPMSGAHISIVRGDIEGDGVSWERNLNGEEIVFHYSGKVISKPPYVWLPVWGEDLAKIRMKVGMPRDPLMNFHMSIGKADDFVWREVDRKLKQAQYASGER